MLHQSVLLEQVLNYLNPQPNQNFIDCNIGLGGHSKAIANKTAPEGKILGIDWDSETLLNLKNKLQTENTIDRFILENNNFVNLQEIVAKYNFSPVHGILFDLGLSLDQIKKGNRGFSFAGQQPLDMRLGQTALTAEKIVNDWSFQQLTELLENTAQESFAKKIARKIIAERAKEKIATTDQLVAIIKKAVPLFYTKKKIHFATKTFLALRIAVNDELNNLKKALPQAVGILEPNHCLAVISFHSAEDTIVKKYYKEAAQAKLIKILTIKPITSSQIEIKNNPRCRSAKLRTCQKI